MSEANSIYINPLTDFGFKFLFGQEGHKEFLLSFLNAVMGGSQEIIDVEYVDKEKLDENKDSRALIYDLHCKLADGSKIIVEMQNRYQTNFRDRAIYYLSGDIYHQGIKGTEWDYKLTPVYGVFLMNFDWREGPEEHLREDVCLVNMRTHEVFSDRLAMTFLKIPMMVKDAEECRDTLDRWLYLLKNMEKMESIPTVFLNDPVFRKLGEVARVAVLDKKERRAYENSLKIYRDNYAIALTERSEGFAEGEANIIRRMMANGKTVEEISDLTGYSIPEIKRLLAQS